MAGRSVKEVEARGFEPRSELRSTTASTCVALRSMFPSAGRRTADCRMIPLEFRPLAEDAPGDYPRFAILVEPPWEGFPSSTPAKNVLDVTQREPSCCWQLERSRVF